MSKGEIDELRKEIAVQQGDYSRHIQLAARCRRRIAVLKKRVEEIEKPKEKP